MTPAATSGPPVPPWGGRRAAAALNRVRARGVRNTQPCCICGQPIDYRLKYPNSWSCSVQHVKPRARYPELTWDPSNWAPAHLRCNWEASTGEPTRPTTPPDLGIIDTWN